MIDELREKFAHDEFEFARHAVDRMILRAISVHEVREVIGSAEIIEDYPEDKYGPSCLLFGNTSGNRPLHVQCTYPSRRLVKVITVYEPDPGEWVGFRTRRTQDGETGMG